MNEVTDGPAEPGSFAGSGAAGDAEAGDFGASVGARPRVTIYSDGACRGNPGVGGYASIVVSAKEERELSGVEPQTTNNRMELTAAIRGVEALSEPSIVHIVTDSTYLVKGMTEWIRGWVRRGWKTAANKPVLNRDLWEQLLAVSAQHVVTWEWVRGHAGHEFNERCDQLANDAMDNFLRS